MKLSIYNISGALFAISAISWGILLWYHFDDAHAFFFLPGIFCLGIGGILEVTMYENEHD